MMQIHFSRRSKKCFYDVFSSRCRLIKNAKLNDKKIMSDNINNLTLQQKNIELRIHIDKHL
jgi:hypothetical protein